MLNLNRTLHLFLFLEVARVHGVWWQPKASDHLTWQWQLQGDINLDFKVDMYDIDLFDAPQSAIDTLHAEGKIVICYFSAGTYESWRPDWATYFDFLKTGVDYQGTELPFAGKLDEWNERWLDIRELGLLQPIMKARMELAASKQCDGVEPDNMDAYMNGDETGISLTAADQLTYNKWIAQTAHSLGLSVGLKNDLDQLPDLIDDFDFAVNEQCFEYDECSSYTDSFIAADKAVFGVEYSGSVCRFCPEAESLQLSWMKKKILLGSYRRGCTDFWTRILCWWSFLLA